MIQQGGDYVRSLKGNQGSLQEDVSTYLASNLSPDATVVSIDGDHGRIETRAVLLTGQIDWLKGRHAWTGPLVRS